MYTNSLPFHMEKLHVWWARFYQDVRGMFFDMEKTTEPWHLYLINLLNGIVI